MVLVGLGITVSAQKSIDQKVTELMAKMTLEEKIGQLNQYNDDITATGPITKDADKAGQVRAGKLGSILNAVGAKNTKNVAYYIIAHASKFVPQNSQRIGSTQVGNLSTVAFRTPEGKIALIVLNEGAEVENFNINFDGKSVAASLPSNSVATYTF